MLEFNISLQNLLNKKMGEQFILNVYFVLLFLLVCTVISLCFYTGHFVMVPLNLTCLHCLHCLTPLQFIIWCYCVDCKHLSIICILITRQNKNAEIIEYDMSISFDQNSYHCGNVNSTNIP